MLYITPILFCRILFCPFPEENQEFKKRIVSQKQLQQIQQQLSKEMEQKFTNVSKREFFNKIVLSQKAIGQFVDVETFINELQSFDYQGIDKIIIQTFFIVELLKEKFKEYKIEWKLLVKKANQWLKQQNVVINDEMKQIIMNIIQSLSF